MSATQPFPDDAEGGDGYFNISQDYLKYYHPPNPDIKSDSIHAWQHGYTREQVVAVKFKTSKTNGQDLWIKANQRGYSARFAIIGGTTFPRLVLRLGLVHPMTTQQNISRNISLELVWPVYGEDGHKIPRDIEKAVPGQRLNAATSNSMNPAGGGTFTLSNAMIGLKYETLQNTDQGNAEISGIPVGEVKLERIAWSTEIPPSASRFNDDLRALQFTQEQINVAATFRQLLAPGQVAIFTTRPANLDMQFRLLIAMPTPCLPPFPTVDARYNPSLKCMKPIHVSNILTLQDSRSGTVREHFGLRTQGWYRETNLQGTLLTSVDERRVIPIPYKYSFENKRHYEAIQMLGIAREVQAQRPDTAGLFNKSYGFTLVPILQSYDGTEFLIHLNVRPMGGTDRHESDMVPPEAGTRVEIEIQQGEVNPGVARIASGPASRHSSGQASQAARSPPNIPASPPQATGSRQSSAPGSTSVRSPPTSPTPRSRRGTGSQMPNIGAMVLSTEAPISTFQGPTAERMTNIVTWSGIVVPNPQSGAGQYDVCIYLRVASAAQPMGGLGLGQRRNGKFKFGIANSGTHAQAEQAIRLVLHGDGSFYGIPPSNWMNWLLFARENRAMKNEGRGQPATPSLRMHASFNNKQLTAKQGEALEAALTNTHPADEKASRKNDKTNHFFVVIKGPPGTGKSTVSQCIAYHCFAVNEKLLVACGANRPLSHLANKVLEILPKTNKNWLVPNCALGVFRLEVEYDESYDQIDRNAQAYQHTFDGEYEPSPRIQELQEAVGVVMDEVQFRNVENYVKRRITTGRPLSLGDHILVRLKKARAQRHTTEWTFDVPELYDNDESKKEYQLLWDFIGWRNMAAKHSIYYYDIIGETNPQRKARFNELDDMQKAIARETSKAWRNLQSFYLKHAKIIFCTAQTAGRRILKTFRAHRVIVEEAGQLDEPNTINSFVRSYTTLRKVILSGDDAQLPPTLISYNMNEAANYRRTSLFERLVHSGVEVIQLNIQFRMDPAISNFISQQFYKSELKNSSSVLNRMQSRTFKDWIKQYAAKNGKTVQSPAASLFISVNDTKVVHRKGSTSPFNPGYVERTHDVVMDFLDFLYPKLGLQKRSDLKGKLHMAVACYYQQELSILKKWLHDIEHLEDIVEVVTVDATQGWEWDLVVLSTTRPGGQYGLGFIRDQKRMNVSLSRAKFGQITIGHKDMSQGDGPKSFQSPWQAYWRYHRDTLKCFLEFDNSEQKVINALNIDPASYQEMASNRET